MEIRELAAADQPRVQSLLQQNTNMPIEEIEQALANGRRLVALQGESLCGFAALTPGSPGAYSVVIAVEPTVRRQGIGRALWKQLATTLSAEDKYVCCPCPAESVAGHAFLQAIAFAPWFSDDLMFYAGSNLPEPSLNVRPYRDEDCATWIALINEGFYPLRNANDIEPYHVFRADAADDPAFRQRFLSSGDEKLLFYDGDQLIGLAALVGAEIDPVLVVSEQRGRGYGKQIMAYCTNRILERRIGPAKLSVVRINASARRLYESVGYRLVAQHDWFRLKLG
ncbi:MAG: GNAT family N-acetyltransferase [Bacillota bacterium]